MKSRPDLLLLLSLIAVILLHPVLDHGTVRRMILAGLIFFPVVVSTIRLSQIKHWLWSSLLLGGGIFIFTIANEISPNPLIASIKWGLLAVYFGLTVVGLFSCLKNAHSITASHLYTAISIYLLIALLWFALYCLGSSLYPESIASSHGAFADRQSELLYFSLVTLTTLGYGDIVAVYSEVRMLAALEAVTGVLYVAITIAILVRSYRWQSPGSDSGVPPDLPALGKVASDSREHIRTRENIG